MDGIERVPDHLRCRRTDGKRWRCPRLALKHVSFCELHQVQARRRQYKLPVPDSLKLRRGRRGRMPSPTPVALAVDHRHVPKKRRVEIPGEVGEADERVRNVDGGYLVGFTRMMGWRRKMGNVEESKAEEGMEKNVPVERSRIRVQRRKIRTKKKEETFDGGESAGIKGHIKNTKRKETARIGRKFVTLKRKQPTAIKTKEESLKSKKLETSGIGPKDGTSVRESTEIKSEDETLARDAWLTALPSKQMTLQVQRSTGKWKEYFRVRKEAMVSPMPLEELETNQRNVSPMQQIIPEVSEECSVDLPDHLRCRRSDGKRWRCRRRAMENHYYCQLHYIQQYRRQYKLGVPESLKLKRKSCGPVLSKTQVFDQIPKERTKRMTGQGEEARKVHHRVKRRKKIESLLVELMQMVLKRQMERREKEEIRKHKESVEVMRKLPNGLMAISPASNAANSRNNGHHLDRKLCLDPSSFLRWCFRSKNVELPSVGTVHKRHQKRVCHHCQNSSMCQTIRCSSCKKGFFCKTCVKKWYSGLSAEDVKAACPICRGRCHCAACLPARFEEPDTIFHSVKVRWSLGKNPE